MKRRFQQWDTKWRKRKGFLKIIQNKVFCLFSHIYWSILWSLVSALIKNFSFSKEWFSRMFYSSDEITFQEVLPNMKAPHTSTAKRGKWLKHKHLGSYKVKLDVLIWSILDATFNENIMKIRIAFDIQPRNRGAVERWSID